MRVSAVLRAVVVSSLFAGVPLAAEADDIFLSMAGVTGDSVVEGFEGWIDVMSMSEGVSFTNKASFQNVFLMVGASSASPVIEQAVPSARRFATAAIWFRRGGAQPFTYLKVTLTDVTVTALQRGGASGGGAPVDSITLSFSKIKTEYVTQTSTGATGPTITACWDVKNNVACQ